MDNLHVSIHCPFCNQYSHLQPAPASSGNPDIDRMHIAAAWEKTDGTLWWIGICNSCHNPVLVKNDGQVVYPYPQPMPANEKIPESIRTDINEANICFSISAYRACAVMARRAIQATALERGMPDIKLQDQIIELEKRGIITADIRKWADAVRWIGNDAAHPTGDPVIKEDAEDILKLAEQILHIIYISSSIAEDIRKRKGRA